LTPPDTKSDYQIFKALPLPEIKKTLRKETKVKITPSDQRDQPPKRNNKPPAGLSDPSSDEEQKEPAVKLKPEPTQRLSPVMAMFRKVPQKDQDSPASKLVNHFRNLKMSRGGSRGGRGNYRR
jgi:hypothetical protein